MGVSERTQLYEEVLYVRPESLINKILYVPFNHDYIVDENIREALTEEEFFKRCYFKPDFDKEIQELLMISEDEVQAFEVELTREELISKYDRMKTEEEVLYDWIEGNQNDIYTIKGDAGTGKSTFLHYLKYHYQKKNIEWEIVDIQRAIDMVKVLGNTIYINRFSSLYYKAISVIIICICDALFEKEKDGKIDYSKSVTNLKKIRDNYLKLQDYIFPGEKIVPFFDSICNIMDYKGEDKKICQNSAKSISQYFKKSLPKVDNMESRTFATFLELYIIFLKCKCMDCRYMIAFDNFERFIGTDEIYSRQLIEFVEILRQVQNNISINNISLSKMFQIIIFMRNTSTRMFTSQQVAELFPHKLDLSEWFNASKILKKKLDWYNEKKIEISESERLLEILGDVGGHFRGLRSKLNMLFNNNKRAIIKFLSQVLSKPVNQKYLNIYDYFRKNKAGITPSYARFAARVIVFRLVLNELRSDDFFRHIIVQKNNDERASLGYARKILTILYNYRLQHDQDSYMSFFELIKQLHKSKLDSISQYFSSNNTRKRRIISQVLYYMNYYDGRTENWLQFIDIQYNLIKSNKVRIENCDELNYILEHNYKDIKIRITSAGVSYLYFVVYIFEYFACKSIQVDAKKKEFGSDDLPPFLCTIPTKNEILNTDLDKLLCVKVLKIVSDEALNCISVIAKDENSIPFVKNYGDTPILHKDRIIHSHMGFIDNYIYCMRKIFKDELKNDQKFREKLEQLVSKMEKIRDKYLAYQNK